MNQKLIKILDYWQESYLRSRGFAEQFYSDIRAREFIKTFSEPGKEEIYWKHYLKNTRIEKDDSK